MGPRARARYPTEDKCSSFHTRWAVGPRHRRGIQGGRLLLLPSSLKSHHGWQEFDEKAEVTVEGTVTDFHYVNPHCVVEFDVKDGKGRIQKWQGEFSNPGVLSRRGWNAAYLEVGDKLKITGHPARNGVLALHVTKILSASGELKLELRE